MQKTTVIARANLGEPLVRLVIYAQGRLVYLADPDREKAVESGDSIPIGFPDSDIFIYSSVTYERLRTEWDHTGDVSRETWNKCPMFQVKHLPV